MAGQQPQFFVIPAHTQVLEGHESFDAALAVAELAQVESRGKTYLVAEVVAVVEPQKPQVRRLGADRQLGAVGA